MKTITLTEDNGEKYQVNIVYSVFDMRNPLLEENFETASAETAQQALKAYNKKYGYTDKYKRTDAYSLAQDATVCVSSLFYDKNGIRYKYGRRTWFKLINT
jgi:nucleosome binding factor SPN SPT16 subunit